jgi:hypothetical protein
VLRQEARIIEKSWEGWRTRPWSGLTARLWAAVGWEWLRFEAKHERAKGPDTEGPREYPLARINR